MMTVKAMVQFDRYGMKTSRAEPRSQSLRFAFAVGIASFLAAAAFVGFIPVPLSNFCVDFDGAVGALSGERVSKEQVP